jgi:hypothetical protein
MDRLRSLHVEVIEPGAHRLPGTASVGRLIHPSFQSPEEDVVEFEGLIASVRGTLPMTPELIAVQATPEFVDLNAPAEVLTAYTVVETAGSRTTLLKIVWGIPFSRIAQLSPASALLKTPASVPA